MGAFADLLESPDYLKEQMQDRDLRIHELEQDLENMTREKYEQYDRAEKLQEEIEALEGRVRVRELEAEKEEIGTDLEILENEKAELSMTADLVAELTSCYERLELGVQTEGQRIREIIRELRGVVR